jgi:hypothetical protein
LEIGEDNKRWSRSNCKRAEEAAKQSKGGATHIRQALLDLLHPRPEMFLPLQQPHFLLLKLLGVLDQLLRKLLDLLKCRELIIVRLLQ